VRVRRVMRREEEVEGEEGEEEEGEEEEGR
jgi:hypothetical protein